MSLSSSSATSSSSSSSTFDTSHLILANEIKNAKEDIESEEKLIQRSKYIKEQLDKFSEEQLDRFEFFVRSHLTRSKVKTLLQSILGQEVSDEIAITVAGLSKSFLGELCDTANDVVKETNSSGIQPDHVLEAYRRMQKQGKIGRPSDTFSTLSLKDSTTITTASTTTTYVPDLEQSWCRQKRRKYDVDI